MILALDHEVSFMLPGNDIVGRVSLVEEHLPGALARWPLRIGRADHDLALHWQTCAWPRRCG